MREFFSILIACFYIFAALPALAGSGGLQRENPEKSATEPIYNGLWRGPTYSVDDPNEMMRNALDMERLGIELREREFRYSMLGVGGMLTLLVFIGLFRRYRNTISTTADHAFIGSLAGAVRTKRRIVSNISGTRRKIAEKIEHRINADSRDR